jgi:lauroyl/myristoyl acyltransferase
VISSDSRRAIRENLADAREVVTMVVFTAFSWLWPIDRLLPLARALRRLKWWRGDPYARSAPAEIPPPQFARHYSARIDRLLEARMQILAMYRPGRRWRPKVRWQGLQHLEAVLRQGAGAILWQGNFVYNQLVTKMAFRDAGYPFVWLSRQAHGFSAIGGRDSPFAVRFLSPYCVAVENRFIAERIVINEENTLERLGARLRENAIVAMLVWHRGRRTAEVPFLGTGRITIATGPVHLAFISGAPLIPVFTVRADDGVYDISVGPPLAIPRAADVPPGFKLDYEAVIRSYVAMLEPYVRRHPDQWLGWNTVTWGHAEVSARAFPLDAQTP